MTISPPELLHGLPELVLNEIPVVPNVNVLSVDAECWEHIVWRDLTGGYRAACRQCAADTEFLLKLFDDAGVRATFFVLGVFAERFPDLVKSMDALGHEIALHGFFHSQLFTLTPPEFKEDLRRAIFLIEDITGKSAIGYRAPAFSLDTRSVWALQVLAEHGIRYDSSVFPFRGRRYGVPDFPRGIVAIRWKGGGIIEVPLSTTHLAGARLPVAGGGYFRTLPRCVIKWAVTSINREGMPFVTYIHPYEFRRQDLEFGQFSPYMNRWAVSFNRIKFNLFRRTMKTKLRELLQAFPFAPVREVIKNGLEA
ncbi:MAG TPA: polysaccharide deacetylase family protein [Desulfomonilaceae bacterium]|nr:polysaccharide deacetylase family protein [Desulfomonilaceae bacterium]